MFEAYAAQNKPIIDAWLLSTLDEAAIDTDFGSLLPEIRRLMARGGKRLRPLLCLLAYQGYGGHDSVLAIPVAGSTELLHTFLLMHDDVIDGDVIRWGDRNITGRYLIHYEHMPATTARRAAEAQAILAGDVCYALAQQTILNLAVSPTHCRRLLALQQRVVVQVLAGESDDVQASTEAAPPTEDRLLRMYAHKTASYSFVLPLQTGAMLAGTNTAQLQQLQALGSDIGIAYQLQDDYLGIFGTPKHTGKPGDGDIVAGKLSWLVSRALLNLPDSDARRLRTIVAGEATSSSAQITVARQLIADSGAADQLVSLAQVYIDSAMRTLDASTMNAGAKQHLAALIQKLTQRTT